MNTPGFVTSTSGRGRYRFGDFVLDLGANCLRRDGVEVPLRPKAFDVLQYLVLHHGTLVTKDELAKSVWADVAVTDNSLAQCILEIRRALDDDEQRIVRTVARRGYVFDAPITSAFAEPRHVPEPPGGPIAVSDSAPRLLAGKRRLVRSWQIGVAAAVLLGAAFASRSALRLRSPTAADDTPVQLTNFNDSAIAPALSHDGRMLAFVRGGSFGKVGAPGGQVYVKLLDGGAPVQLTRGPMSKTHPVFSPDDSRIIYTALSPGLRWDSWQVPVLGGTERSFLPNASGLEWLADGRLVYSTIRTGIHMGIAISTEARGDYREIYFPDHADGMAHRSAASPDGKWLLVVEMSAGTWLPCRLVPIDGSTPGTRVGPPGAQCTTAAWSPDGRWMYLSSNAGGEFHIWRQRFPNGRPEQLTFGPTEQEGTAITPDGRHLITSMGLQQASIWLHDASGDRKLTDEGFVAQPTWSAAGERMFYLVRTRLSRAQSSGELWQLDITTGERQRILPGLVLANYSVSSDETSIVYSPSSGDADDGIWIARVDGREPPRQLVRGSGLRAFFASRGEVIYQGEDGYLYRIGEDGSKKERASADRVAYLVSVSPDGRWAQAVMPRSSGGGTTSLWFVSLRGEQSFEVCNEACSLGPRSFLITAPFAWSRDGKSLLVNLWHFGNNTARSVVLPYRPEAPPHVLWPAGLDREANVVRNPGARAFDAVFTMPAGGADDYLFARVSTQSNLYRVRIPS